MVQDEDGNSIEFNFCGELYERNQCQDLNGKATLKKKDGTCVNLAADDSVNGKALVTPSDLDLSDNDDDGGLTVSYDGGD
jgi:hypothetical protein